MRFLILGATGRTGVLFVKKALDEGHEVSALVRRADAAIDPRAHIVSGDVTDSGVIATAAQGHDAVISTLGVKSARKTPTLITDTVRAVIASTHTSGVDRFLIVSAFGVGDSLAKASFLVTPIFRTMLRKTYADKAESEVLLRASNLKWTLEYPGALNDRSGSRYSAVALEDVTRLPVLPFNLSLKRRRLPPPLRRARHLSPKDCHRYRHQGFIVILVTGATGNLRAETVRGSLDAAVRGIDTLVLVSPAIPHQEIQLSRAGAGIPRGTVGEAR